MEKRLGCRFCLTALTLWYKVKSRYREYEPRNKRKAGAICGGGGRARIPLPPGRSHADRCDSWRCGLTWFDALGGARKRLSGPVVTFRDLGALPIPSNCSG